MAAWVEWLPPQLLLLGLSGCLWLLVVACVQWFPMVACTETDTDTDTNTNPDTGTYPHTASSPDCSYIAVRFLCWDNYLTALP